MLRFLSLTVALSLLFSAAEAVSATARGYVPPNRSSKTPAFQVGLSSTFIAVTAS